MTWPPSRYFQIPNNAAGWLPEVGVHAFAVYVALCRMADRSGECFPSRTTLAMRSGVSERATRMAEAILIAAGLIAVDKRVSGGGACRSNLYRINGEPLQPEGASGAGGARGATLAPCDTIPPHGAPPPPGAPCGDEGARRAPHNKDPLEQDPLEQTTSPKLRFEDDDMAIAGEIFAAVKKLNPNHKRPKLDAWANTIRLMRERDGPDRSPAGIRALFAWANQDPFWRQNILSPEKLREKWDQLTIRRNGTASHERPAERKPSIGQRFDPNAHRPTSL